MTNPEDLSDRPYEGWYFHFTEQWSQFFYACNWRGFTLLKLHVEDDTIMGGVELEVFLLGLGVRIRYNHTRTKLVDELSQIMQDIDEGKITLKDLKLPTGKDNDRKDSPTDEQ